MGTIGKVRKLYILEAYSSGDILAYKVRVDDIDGDFICNHSALRYLLTKFYCVNAVCYEKKIQSKKRAFQPSFLLAL